MPLSWAWGRLAAKWATSERSFSVGLHITMEKFKIATSWETEERKFYSWDILFVWDLVDAFILCALYSEWFANVFLESSETEAPFVRGRALLPSTTRQSKISLATLIKKLSEASALKGRCLDASPNQATNIGKFHWYFSPSHSHPGSSPKPPRPLHGGQDRNFGKNGLHPSVLSK